MAGAGRPSMRGRRVLAALAGTSLLLAGVARGAADSVGRSTLDHYHCLAEFRDGQYAVHWALGPPPPGCDPTGLEEYPHGLVDPCSERKIDLAVQARFFGDDAERAEREGFWLAFGLAEAGGLLGADVVAYDSASKRLVDAHTLETPHLIADDRSNWALANASTRVEAAHAPRGRLFEATVRVSRSLRSTDRRHDRDFDPDANYPFLPTKVIGNAGVGPLPAVLGERSHTPTHAQGALRFHAPGCVADVLLALRDTPGVRRVGVNVTHQRVKGLRNNKYAEYTHVCINKADVPGLPGGALHILAIDVLLQPANASKYIHHMGFKGAYIPCGRKPAGKMIAEDLFFWTHGVEPVLLPPEAGIRIGDRRGYQSFVIQYHYELPESSAEVFDASGVQLYVTDRLRRYDAGVIQLGDGGISMIDRAVGEGYNKHAFTCPSQCSRDHFRNDVLHVFRRGLHMHALGTMMKTTQFSASGQKIREDEIDFFDFHATSAFEPRSIDKGFVIRRGDWFTVECTYRTEPGSPKASFGFGSKDEMCIDFVHYYPKEEPGYCSAKMPLVKMIEQFVGDDKLKNKLKMLPNAQSITEGGDDACHGSYTNSERLSSAAELRRAWGGAAPKALPNSSSYFFPDSKPVKPAAPARPAAGAQGAAVTPAPAGAAPKQAQPAAATQPPKAPATKPAPSSGTATPSASATAAPAGARAPAEPVARKGGATSTATPPTPAAPSANRTAAASANHAASPSLSPAAAPTTSPNVTAPGKAPPAPAAAAAASRPGASAAAAGNKAANK